MTNLCEQFAENYSLKFSTNVDVSKSKTKCIIFSKTVIDIIITRVIILNNLPLPYVNEVKHLGDILQSENSLIKNCSFKRLKHLGDIP